MCEMRLLQGYDLCTYKQRKTERNEPNPATAVATVRASSMEDTHDASKAPGVALYSHILQKGFQAGSVLGVGVVSPALAAYQAFRHKQPLDVLKLVGTAGKTNLYAFGATALLGALRMSQIDRDGLEDRAYRLHYNKGQARTDWFAQAGAVAGLAAGAVLLRGAANVSALHYLGCSSAGAAAGVLLHVLTRPREE